MKYAKPILLSRRDFIKLSAVTSVSMVLSACDKISASEISPKFTETPTPKPIDTLRPTHTPIPFDTATPSPTSTPHRLTFRDITERTGTYICATVSGDEDWQSPAYSSAENEFFSGSFIQNSFMRDVVNKWTDYTGKEFLKRARSANQLTIIHPGFWNLNTLLDDNNQYKVGGKYIDPIWYAPPEEVMKVMEGYANYVMSHVKKVTDTEPPTVIHIANEIWSYDLDAGGSYSAWSESPYNTASLKLEKNPIVEAYMKHYNAATKRGLTVGKDVRLSISDYNLINTGGKTQFVHDLYLEAKQEIAKQIGMPIDDVQFDVSLECHEFVTNRPSYHRPYPSQDELEEVIGFWHKDFTGVHLTEINAVGKIDQDVSNKTLIKYLRAGIKKHCVSTSIWNSLRVTDPTGGNDPFYHDHQLFDDAYKPTVNYYTIVDAVNTSI